MFDSSSVDSFRTARSMMEAVTSAAGETLPCVLVAGKDDLGMAQVWGVDQIGGVATDDIGDCLDGGERDRNCVLEGKTCIFVLLY